MSAPATFLDGRVTLHAGDCLDVLDSLPEASVDAVVTDPPYHFDTIVQRFGKEGSAEAGFGSDGIFRRASAGFMGKSWDGGDIAFDPATWARVLRVLKPGGMLAAFSAPKCYHKMVFAIERAGFEMRDRVVHLYDLTDREVAFLESLSPAQADAFAAIIAAGDPLGDLLWTFGSGFPKGLDVAKAIDKHLGAQGEVVPTGAAVKRMIPGADQNSSGSWIKDNGRAYQPGSYVPATDEAAHWDGWNIALKPAYEPIALARKPLAEKSVACQVLATGTGAINIDACRVGDDGGRWPANITHDGSDAATAAFPEAPGQIAPVRPDSGGGRKTTEVYGAFATNSDHDPRGDSGSAARFFYTAKAKAEDRLGSGHPTVKPINLMLALPDALRARRHHPRPLCRHRHDRRGGGHGRLPFDPDRARGRISGRHRAAHGHGLRQRRPAARARPQGQDRPRRRRAGSRPSIRHARSSGGGAGRSIYGHFRDQDGRSARSVSSDE